MSEKSPKPVTKQGKKEKRKPVARYEVKYWHEGENRRMRGRAEREGYLDKNGNFINGGLSAFFRNHTSSGGGKPSPDRRTAELLATQIRRLGDQIEKRLEVGVDENSRLQLNILTEKAKAALDAVVALYTRHTQED
jgi:hypothetical protein